MTREEAIKTLKGEAWLCCAEKWNEALEMAIKALEQEPKTGHWIGDKYDYSCDICGHSLLDIAHSIDYISFEKPKYCPNCGANMAESEEA